WNARCGRSSRRRKAAISATGWSTTAARSARRAPRPIARAAACGMSAAPERKLPMQTPTETPLGGALRSQQTAEWLLPQLRSGQLAGAVQLPSEKELAGMLGVSRTVVRDALSVLERAGYMERVRGIGTLVNREVLEADNRLDQKIEFYSMIRAAGYEPH